MSTRDATGCTWVLAAAAVVLSLVACAMDETTRSGTLTRSQGETRDFPTGTGSKPTSGGMTLSQFGADHAEADVDWLLARSRGQSNSGSTVPSAWSDQPIGPLADAAGPVSAAARTQVMFNDAGGSGTGRRIAEAPTQAQQPPTGQGNLFREAETKSSDLPVRESPSRETLRPDRISKLMVDLSRELYAAGAYSDMPLRELLAIAAMSMIDPQRRLEPSALPDLSARERELLGALQEFFVSLGRELDGSADAEAVIDSALTALRQALVAEPQLVIQTVALCKRVGGFGDFDEIKRRRFLAHAEEAFALYLEVANFSSELNKKDEWITELSLQLVIYADRDGIPVWRQDWQPAIDRSKKKRTDFFIAQRITLPKALSVGKYDLKIRVRDDKSGSIAETGVPFEMVADSSMTRE